MEAAPSQELFESLLAESVRAHGHLCPGQVVGIRMALLGGRLAGLRVPCQGPEIKKLLVYVEMDRCAADAMALATGVRLGRRSLKFKDYGIMAATFLNLETGKAFRVISTESARTLAPLYAPELADPREQQLEAYRRMPDCALFRVQEVKVNLDRLDLPGPTGSKVTCESCGQVVRDGREKVVGGRKLCAHCAGEGYLKEAREISWEGMDWSPAAPERPEPEEENDLFRLAAASF